MEIIFHAWRKIVRWDLVQNCESIRTEHRDKTVGSRNILPNWVFLRCPCSATSGSFLGDVCDAALIWLNLCFQYVC